MLIFFFWDANTLKESWIRRCWCAGNNRCFGRAGKAGKEIAKRISGERSQTKKLVITGLSFFFSEQEAPSYQSATQLSPFFQDFPLITIILVIIITIILVITIIIILVISVSTFNGNIIEINVLFALFLLPRSFCNSYRQYEKYVLHLITVVQNYSQQCWWGIFWRCSAGLRFQTPISLSVTSATFFAPLSYHRHHILLERRTYTWMHIACTHKYMKT